MGEGLASRPAIADLARAAGVSVATVDRVLNSRLRVREETARRVKEAATAISCHAAPLIRQRVAAALPEVRLGFVLQKEHQPFHQAFARKIRAAADRLHGVRAVVHVSFVKNQTPEDVVAALDALARRCQAVALTSLDHHSVTRVASPHMV